MKYKYTIGKAGSCFIYDEETIKVYGMRGKKLKAVRNSYKDCFLRESMCLRKLKNYLHFPTLLHSDMDLLAIKMTNVGDSLFNTWHEHNLNLYIDQAHKIADAMEEQEIFYFYPGLDPKDNRTENMEFPLSNFCILDGELSLIDFELAWCEGAPTNERLKFLYRHFDREGFRNSLINALKYPFEAWGQELRAKLTDPSKWDILQHKNPRKVFNNMGQFTQPSDSIVKQWNKYQKRFGLADMEDRVKRMKLMSLLTNESEVVDIGCNDGYFSMHIASNVKSVTGVEPFVPLTEDKPGNVNWEVKTFDEFRKSTDKTYDVLLSLAVSIQLRDFGGYTEQEIVDAYYDLVKPGGVVVHETQKLEARPNNIDHTEKMIAAFKTKFIQEDHGQARISGKREYYHFRKK